MEKTNNTTKIARKLLALLNDLLSILEEEGTEEVGYALKNTRYCTDLLNTCLNEEEHNLEKILKEIKSTYRSLYPPHGGLTDFFIWRDDFKERVKVNQPLNEIKDELWRLIETV